jgi:hypothetical protein
LEEQRWPRDGQRVVEDGDGHDRDGRRSMSELGRAAVVRGECPRWDGRPDGGLRRPAATACVGRRAAMSWGGRRRISPCGVQRRAASVCGRRRGRRPASDGESVGVLRLMGKKIFGEKALFGGNCFFLSEPMFRRCCPSEVF